jgi:hypothetical protein
MFALSRLLRDASHEGQLVGLTTCLRGRRSVLLSLYVVSYKEGRGDSEIVDALRKQAELALGQCSIRTLVQRELTINASMSGLQPLEVRAAAALAQLDSISTPPSLEAFKRQVDASAQTLFPTVDTDVPIDADAVHPLIQILQPLVSRLRDMSLLEIQRESVSLLDEVCRLMDNDTVGTTGDQSALLSRGFIVAAGAVAVLVQDDSPIALAITRAAHAVVQLGSVALPRQMLSPVLRLVTATCTYLGDDDAVPERRAWRDLALGGVHGEEAKSILARIDKYKAVDAKLLTFDVRFHSVIQQPEVLPEPAGMDDEAFRLHERLLYTEAATALAISEPGAHTGVDGAGDAKRRIIAEADSRLLLEKAHPLPSRDPATMFLDVRVETLRYARYLTLVRTGAGWKILRVSLDCLAEPGCFWMSFWIGNSLENVAESGQNFSVSATRRWC